MEALKHRYITVIFTIVGVAVLLSIFTQPAMAQIRPAMVRDVDTPALTPFFATVDYYFNTLNDQRLLTTVPAGKRLVIEYISYWSAGPIGDQLVFATLRRAQYGTLMVMMQINPPHPSADSSYTIQDGSQMVKAYFEAGDQVWVSASHNTNGYRDFNISVFGYYVTP
ncbi:MAG TPA: hypothetical protein VN577_20455 [Terriglobales bacterium]|nr:hypothetical protein [Terriglobales bacterium]